MSINNSDGKKKLYVTKVTGKIDLKTTPFSRQHAQICATELKK